MTKDEVLKLTEPDEIWDAMQGDPALREDHDVWRHLTRLTAKRRKQEYIDLFGHYDPDFCYDPLPVARLKEKQDPESKETPTT